VTRLRRTFASLSNRNYRLYFVGHGISATGEWAQKIGQAWLVLELSGSGTLLGITAGLQHLPTLVIGPWGGLLADRVDKRRLLLATQVAAGALALTLGLLTATGMVEVWMVMVLALMLGSVKALDKPAKQNLVLDMVGPADLANAVVLNSVVHNVAKAAGPAIAGMLIATVGIAASFYANAASYFAVLLALVLIRPAELQPAPRTVRGPGQLREGLRYVWATPRLRGPLLLMTVSGVLAYEWAVTLPLLARDAFGGDAQTFGTMFSAMGLGAVIGGLAVASSMKPRTNTLLGTALVFSGLMLLTAGTPTLGVAFVALFLLGGASVAFRSTATALIQLRSAPEMRGRVMSLLSVALVGTTPLGGPLMGWLAEVIGIRFTFALGGVATAVAAVASFLWVRRRRRAPDGQPVGVVLAPSFGDR
jgi:predicted MFS family arabinose efflux permease